MEIKLSKEEEKKIIAFKNNMHMYPELSNFEFDTTKNIKRFLSEIEGVEIISLGVETGVVAMIKGAKNGKTIGLRCDIDAINQEEAYVSEYKSKVPGVMHGCGHDFHTAALLGTVQIISRLKDNMSGNVVFLFQKAEETTTGAKEYIDSGLFDLIKIDYFFGLHNWPLVDSGKVICKKGALMSAKTNFEIEVIGRGGHGSMPHLNVDPIVCAATIVTSLQTVLSRNTDPFAPMVFSINYINGGSKQNLVVNNTVMSATIRSLDQKAMERAKERVEEIVKYTCKAYECEYKITYFEDIPVVYNTDKMYQLAYSAAKKIVEVENIIAINPTMASEDFALIMEKVPSFMYWFGSGTPGEKNEALHNAKFNADNSALKIASEVLASAAISAQNE